ncbi:acyl-CoA thioesterase [Paeniglutamicibacter sp. ABSL32-1]|uniref:acyl-CoA thioesterase n=1 Tax=Paeniglutamicibacter quisquiliarum TaxID=2849498 RepID=UPI001C2D67D3|nr:thioesterase family protein [Paeniglutamicibacter quisquiliarum]MBV1778146.1 acyl-CoA thioesterase [Paeniglutamicibacter quisquiliarum]
MVNEIEERVDAGAADVARLVEDFLAGKIRGASLERTIEWVDTDAAGHQHNSAIMRFVEAAEARLFRLLGATSYFGIAPRVRHEIDYRAKLYFGQQVSAAIAIEHVGTSSMAFVFKVWGHPHEGREPVLAAEGRFVTVCVPQGAEESAPWPETILTAIASKSTI